MHRSNKEGSPFLQPCEFSQVSFASPLGSGHSETIIWTAPVLHAPFNPQLFLPSPQNSSCAFVLWCPQQLLPSCCLPNPLCDLLHFSFLPRLDFRSSFSESSSAAETVQCPPPSWTLPGPSHSPVSQKQIKQTPICYPSVLPD